MKRILSITLSLMLLISSLCCAMAESVTLDAWQNEAGWTSFAVLAQGEDLHPVSGFYGLRGLAVFLVFLPQAPRDMIRKIMQVQ